MDKISECASSFKKLCDVSYKFIVSFQRKTREINLNFQESDFFHLAGLQYISDLAIPKNRKITIYNILKKKCITDEMLGKSKHFCNKNSEIDVKSRIEELCYLEDYLDSENIIKIFSIKDDVYLNSKIDAEYLIESKLKNRHVSVYIFLTRRKESEDFYCVKSFFVKKKIVYSGNAMYWMYKEKIMNGISNVLFKHKDFIIE